MREAEVLTSGAARPEEAATLRRRRTCGAGSEAERLGRLGLGAMKWAATRRKQTSDVPVWHGRHVLMLSFLERWLGALQHIDN